MLNTAREFLQRNFLDLWAAAYLNTEAGAEDSGAIGMRGHLEFFYSEDLFLQRRVEKLTRLHGNDDSELIARLSGRQIIAYMREHLPEPDPRALNGGSDLQQKKPIVDPAGRFSDGGLDSNRDRAGVGGKRGIRTFPWACLCLSLIASVWGFLFVRTGKRGHLIHDRDPLFTSKFAEILKSGGVMPVKLPPRSPNLKGYAS